jgi:hypothetical protein
MRRFAAFRSRFFVSALGFSMLAATFLVAPVQAGFAADVDASRPAAADLLAFEGRWQRIDDPKDDENRRSAIDRALRSLTWIVRRMATGVLNQTTAPAPELEFVWDGQRLYQNMKGKHGPQVRPIEIDGEFLEIEDDRGVPFSSAWAWTGDGLRVVWKQHQAHGSNVYRIDPETQTLLVEHMIQVTAISDIDQIVFHSRFNRSRPHEMSAASRNPAVGAATNLR